MGIFFLDSKDGKRFLMSKDGNKYLGKLIGDGVYKVVECETCTVIGEFKTLQELLNKIEEEQSYEA